MTAQDDAAKPTDQEVRDILDAAAVLTAMAELSSEADLGSESHAYAERVLGYAESLRRFAYRQEIPPGGWLSRAAPEHARMLSGWRPADPPPM